MAANRHIQYCITFFSHSWRCHTQVLWFWKRSISQVLRREVPQPIHHALCVNDRLMHKRHQEQWEAAGMKRSESTVKGCDLKDCKAVIRIFNQDFHNSSRYRGRRGGHISSSALSPIGITSSKALTRGNLNAFISDTYVWIFGEWKIFLGLPNCLLVCMLETEMWLFTAQPFSWWRRKCSPSSLSSRPLLDTWVRRSLGNFWLVFRDVKRNKIQHEFLVRT